MMADLSTMTLRAIADDLERELRLYNTGAEERDEPAESREGRRRWARIGLLVTEIENREPASLDDVLVKAWLIRDHMEVFDFGENHKQMLADSIAFLERHIGVQPRDEGALA